MPIARYFLFVGSFLLALLLLADWYAPTLGTGQDRAGVDRTTIRIHSSHKWPQAVVYDTTLPIPEPPPVTTVAVAEPPVPKAAQEAFAMATEPVPAARPADAAKVAKPHVRRTKTARPPDSHVVANSDPFGLQNDWFAPPRREASAGRNDGFGPRGTWRMGW